MCLTVAGIILCVLVPSTLAQAAQISVEPSRLEVSQGENFTINIIIDPEGNEVFSASYHLYFNDTLLNAISQTKGTFLIQDGVNTNVVSNKINNTIGRIKYGENRAGVNYGVFNSGILATIAFQAIGEQGVSDLRLENVKASDPNVTSISIDVNDGTCDIVEQTPTSEPPATATAPAQTIRTPAANRTPSQPLNASTTPTAMQTPDTTQTTPTSGTTATTPPQTTHTPAEKGLPGFEAPLTIVWMLVAFVIRKKAMKK